MKKSDYKAIAQEYDMLRPGYPEEIFQLLMEESHLNTDSLLLEIGAGTGKATVGFINKVAGIDCIEIESAMADILKDKTKGFNVNVSVEGFESWTKEREEQYDLIYSAQAFHWIDQDIKYKKCYELLSDQGKLGLFWYVSIFESDEMYDEIRSVFSKYNTGFTSAKMDMLHGSFNRERKQLEDTEYFTNVREQSVIGKTLEQDAEAFIERFNTTSAYETLEEEAKVKVNEELRVTINKLGGIVRTTIYYNLFIADKSVR